jgi:hypothetical protein
VRRLGTIRLISSISRTVSATRLFLRCMVKYCKLPEQISWWWAITCSKHVEVNLSEINYLKKCASCWSFSPMTLFVCNFVCLYVTIQNLYRRVAYINHQIHAVNHKSHTHVIIRNSYMLRYRLLNLLEYPKNGVWFISYCVHFIVNISGYNISGYNIQATIVQCQLEIQVFN